MLPEHNTFHKLEGEIEWDTDSWLWVKGWGATYLKDNPEALSGLDGGLEFDYVLDKDSINRIRHVPDDNWITFDINGQLFELYQQANK